MPKYCLQARYTKESIHAIIAEKTDRSGPAEKLAGSFGGKLLGFYGVSGQDHHIMVILDMPSQQAYMAVYMKLLQSNAFDMVRTVNLYTGADVVAAATMAEGASYKSPTD